MTKRYHPKLYALRYLFIRFALSSYTGAIILSSERYLRHYGNYLKPKAGLNVDNFESPMSELAFRRFDFTLKIFETRTNGNSLSVN